MPESLQAKQEIEIKRDNIIYNTIVIVFAQRECLNTCLTQNAITRQQKKKKKKKNKRSCIHEKSNLTFRKYVTINTDIIILNTIIIMYIVNYRSSNVITISKREKYNSKQNWRTTSRDSTRVKQNN